MHVDSQAVLAQVRSLRLRVLAEFDSACGYYTSRCLETNSTATSDSPEDLKIITKALLEEEITYAANRNSVEDLFSKQAPPEVWKRWLEAVKTKPLEVIDLEVEIPEDWDAGSKKASVGVHTELAIATAA